MRHRGKNTKTKSKLSAQGEVLWSSFATTIPSKRRSQSTTEVTASPRRKRRSRYRRVRARKGPCSIGIKSRISDQVGRSTGSVGIARIWACTARDRSQASWDRGTPRTKIEPSLRRMIRINLMMRMTKMMSKLLKMKMMRSITKR